METYMSIFEIANYYHLSPSTIKSACIGRNVKSLNGNYSLNDFKNKLNLQ